MRPSLRGRIILALVLLAGGTATAVSGLTAYFLQQTPQLSTNPEMGRALQDALELAKRDYDRRKAALLLIGEELATTQSLAQVFKEDRQRTIDQLRNQEPFEQYTITYDESVWPNLPFVARSSGENPSLRLTVPFPPEGAEGSLILEDPLSELLNIERALQTFGHLEMIVSELRGGLFLSYVVIGVAMVFLALLVGVRIGLGITGPLNSLVRGTRELARDNLDYRIPPGPADEVGLVIESFNHMAKDLQENRRRRVEAEKVAAWREIARRLAHEIKNPLTPIQLTVQQMRDKYLGDDETYTKLLRDCTEIVTEEVQSLRTLVQEFAEFSRMPRLSLVPHDLNGVIADTVRLYPDAPIRLDLTDDLPTVNLDLEGIRRALINLVENALDAAGESGAVAIQSKLDGPEVKIAIVDDGPGIDRKDRERIFEPYVSNKEGGTGLGLTVVRNIIEEHGGTIAATESSSGGARFDINLPAAPPPTEVTP